MRQSKPTERRVWTDTAWKEVLGQAKDKAKLAVQIESEKERLVAEGKLRKVVIKDGKTTRYHYESVQFSVKVKSHFDNYDY